MGAYLEVLQFAIWQPCRYRWTSANRFTTLLTHAYTLHAIKLDVGQIHSLGLQPREDLASAIAALAKSKHHASSAASAEASPQSLPMRNPA